MPENSNRCSVTFTIHYRCEYGRSLYVAVKKSQFSPMSLESAIRLDWQEGDYWSKTVEFELEPSSLCFNYKYIVAPTAFWESGAVLWEEGLKRCLRLGKADGKAFLVEDRWGFQQLKVYVNDVFNPEEHSEKSLGISGPHTHTSRRCAEMKLTSIKSHKDSKIGKFWESTIFWVPLTAEKISLSVYFLDIQKRTVITNRRVDFSYLLNPEKALKGDHKNLKVKGNKLCFREMTERKQYMFNEVHKGIVLGSCINESAERDLLKEADIGAILSLETPYDKERQKRADDSPARGLSKEIPEFNFPIEDCLRDAAQKVLKGAKILKNLMETQLRVYVHCTYGVFRSVHVVIAYLCLYEGMDLFQAIDKVQMARKQARPREELLMKLLRETINIHEFSMKKKSIHDNFAKNNMELRGKMAL